MRLVDSAPLRLLVDEPRDPSSMALAHAEHDRLLVQRHPLEQLVNEMPVALLDADVQTLQLVVGVDLVVVDGLREVYDVAVLHVIRFQRGLAPLHAVRREIAVLDSLMERVDVCGLAEIVVGRAVHVSPRRGREAKMSRHVEVVQNLPPLALVVRAAAMTFVDDHEIKEVLRKHLVLRLVAVLAKERLEQREVYLPVELQLLPGLVAEALARLEVEALESLVCEDVAVGDEEDARLLHAKIRPLPFHRHQLVDELVRDERLSRARGEVQQRAPLAHAELADDGLDRALLVVANLLAARP